MILSLASLRHAWVLTKTLSQARPIVALALSGARGLVKMSLLPIKLPHEVVLCVSVLMEIVHILVDKP
jgi:hypothetical protein